MELLRNYFDIYEFEIILGIGIVVILLLIFNLINKIKISSALKKCKELNNFFNISNSDNIEDSLVDYIKEVDFIKNKIGDIDKKHKELEEKVSKTIQQVGFIRYNAFDDIGSDLSFSLALLDEYSNGVVISNIYARDESNAYAKPIRRGSSSYALSIEEKEVVEMAMSKFKKATE